MGLLLNNPINLFLSNEENALLNKNKTVSVGDNDTISTTSVTFVEVPNNKTKEEIEANDATGDGAIFIEGKKVIQGVNVLEKQYLWDQLAEKEYNKFDAQFVEATNSASSPVGNFECADKQITFKFKARYNKEGTTKISNTPTLIVNKNSVRLTQDKTVIGQYYATVTCPASTNGLQSISATFSFKGNTGSYGLTTKSASGSWSHTTKSVIVNTTGGLPPTAEQITSAESTYDNIRTTTSYKTTAGNDMWICTPGYVNTNYTVSTPKAEGGFGIIFDAPKQVTVNGITYNCRRKQDTPSATTGTINMIIS